MLVRLYYYREDNKGLALAKMKKQLNEQFHGTNKTVAHIVRNISNIFFSDKKFLD